MTKPADGQPENEQSVELLDQWFLYGEQPIGYAAEVLNQDGVLWYRRIHPDKEGES